MVGPCLDSALTTGEEPTTSRSASCGFKEEPDLPWAELNRRLDTDPETTRRWRDKGVRPSMRNMMALVALAKSLGLGHLFTE